MAKGGRTWRRLRAIACLTAFLSVGIVLALHTGWGTLSSMGAGAVAAICPLGALETLVVSGTMVPRAAVSLVAVVAIVLLVGRAFCSWLCPIPPIQRFFRPGKKAACRPPADVGAEEASCSSCPAGCGLPPVGGERDGFRLDSRHAVLAGALVSTAVFGFPVFCLVCPVGLVFATLIAVWAAFAEQTPTWSLFVFPAILLVEVVLFRKWCRKLCPLGALMSLLSCKAPLVKPHVDAGACLRSKGVDCRVCVDACPELLDPHSPCIPECTKCGLCAERCPHQAIDLRLGFTSTKRLR